jgi:hypothetical protein
VATVHTGVSSDPTDGADPDANPAPSTVPDIDPTCTETQRGRYHVRLRPREAFTDFRAPLADERTASRAIAPGCDVREGRVDGTWVVQSVFVPGDAAPDCESAVTLAVQIASAVE